MQAVVCPGAHHFNIGLFRLMHAAELFWLILSQGEVNRPKNWRTGAKSGVCCTARDELQRSSSWFPGGNSSQGAWEHQLPGLRSCWIHHAHRGEPVDAEHRQREASISHGASISRHVARPAPHQPEPRCSARSPLITAPSQLSAAALHHARRNPLRPGPLRGDLPRAAALRGRR